MEKIVVLPFLTVLGMLIGPSIFLKYAAFSITSKVIYCFLLLGACAFIFLGFKQRKFKKGLVMMFVGIVLWALCGLAGLTTGT